MWTELYHHFDQFIENILMSYYWRFVHWKVLRTIMSGWELREYDPQLQKWIEVEQKDRIPR